jgi:glycosyltransferase involved in cell wall biosynthesis
LRTLCLSYEFPPLGGGGARVVDGLARTLGAAGHEIDLVTMGFRGLPSSERLPGVEVQRLLPLRLRQSVCSAAEMVPYLMTATAAATRLAKRHRYALIHAHFIYPDGVVAHLVKRATGLEYVITAHGSDVPGYNPDRFALLHRMGLPLWRRITSEARYIVCPSETLARLVSASNGGARVAVVPNGIDTTRFTPEQKVPGRVLVVTRMFPRKGVQHVLDAVARMRGTVDLHVVGDGPYLTALKEHARSVGVDPRFHGALENGSPELKHLYATSQVFVLPSESENFPVVLLEAMSAGCAIVTTRDTGCAEVVGDAGLLVPARDVRAIAEALDRLVADPGLSAALSCAARTRLVARFGWESVAEQYLRLYREVQAG